MGNYIINYLFKIAHGKYLSDILSGYRAFTLQSISRLQLKEEGFEIEVEMAVQGNVRVAAASRTSFSDALKIAYRSGTITGMLTDGQRFLSSDGLHLLPFSEPAPRHLAAD
jgi:dolichol-phosphate mannosyltransferase